MVKKLKLLHNSLLHYTYHKRDKNKQKEQKKEVIIPIPTMKVSELNYIKNKIEKNLNYGH